MFGHKKSVTGSTLLIAAIMVSVHSVGAKTVWMDSSRASFLRWPQRLETTNLEQGLRPFLENRIERRKNRNGWNGTVSPPPETYMDMLGKTWNSLSQDFIKLYLQAVQLPDSSRRHPSPGGHFEIYYDTAGINSVDMTDRYGYNGPDWRIRVEEPNGVPDYIDETAFALDSSWAMEIGRFGLVAPQPFKTSGHTSDRYKVVVEAQYEGYYALTYLQGKADGERGFTSTISIRNDWSGDEWASLGYDINPINGVRVSCPHEFFHAIQYAMSWNVQSDIWIDDFPYSWTEGTAVCMEELAFDSINDYHQYAQAYFNNPDISFFSPAVSEIVYTNSILTIFISTRLDLHRDAGFIVSMLFNNYQERTPFEDNLAAAATSYNTTWPGIIHAFHRASLFTGTHADTTRFISDAPFFSMRYEPAFTVIDTTHTILPNSVKYVRLLRDAMHGDTVVCGFGSKGRSSTQSRNGYKSCSVILNRDEKIDSILPVIIDSSGNGQVVISSWKSWDELTVVVTNGDPHFKLESTLFVQPYVVTYKESTVVFDTIIDSLHNGMAILRVTPNRDLRSEITFIPDTSGAETDSVADRRFYPVSAHYLIDIPDSWGDGAELQLTLRSDLQFAATDTLFLCMSDTASGDWKELAHQSGHAGRRGKITIPVISSGKYALCVTGERVASRGPEVEVYPNPLSIGRYNGRLHIRANYVTDISIYTLSGVLVGRVTPDPLAQSTSSFLRTYKWDAVDGRSKPVAPGIYTAYVIQKQPGKKRLRTHTKVLVTP